MRTIWKYVIIPSERKQVIEMPRDSKILSVHTQRLPLLNTSRGLVEQICIWALVDPDTKITEKRFFRVYGTGHPVERHECLDFVGTIHMPDAKLVFHVFEDRRPEALLRAEGWDRDDRG